MKNESKSPPRSLFHVTTGRKSKSYRQTGQINGPVRGFDTLMGAMAWAMKTGRKVILRVEPVESPQMLPDHHNDYGRAWWTNSIPIERVKCAYSAEGAWASPGSLTEMVQEIDDYCPGMGCQCSAWDDVECGCGADWTPTEVYALRAALKEARDVLEATQARYQRAVRALESIVQDHMDEDSMIDAALDYLATT